MKVIAYFGLIFALASSSLPAGPAIAEAGDCAGQEGAAYGLCNAYCEAMDCDEDTHRASDKACEVISLRFEKQTGKTLPCESAGCPAWNSGELELLWSAYASAGYMDDQVLRLPHNKSGLMWGDANVYDELNYVYANIQWFPSLIAGFGEVKDGVLIQQKEWLLGSFEVYQACRDLLVNHAAPAY